MHFSHWAGRAFRSVRSLAVVGFVLAAAAVCFAEGFTLKDGTVLRGSLEQDRDKESADTRLVKLDDGLRHIVFGYKRLAELNPNDNIIRGKPFRIAQPLRRSEERVIWNVTTIEGITPFDPFGRRTFSVRDPARNVKVDIAQGITEIYPDYVRVQALNYVWDQYIATSAIPQDQLEPVLRTAIKTDDVDDRLRLAQFFINTGLWVPAANELKSIKEQFPQVAEQVAEALRLLEQHRAEWLLDEVKLRRAAGQNGFAFQALKQAFDPDKAPGAVLNDVRDLTREIETIVERSTQLRNEFDRLHGEIQDAAVKLRFDMPRREIFDELHVENIARLESFLASAANSQIAPEDRLALAVSGWVAGNAFAEANFDRAMRLWDGRAKILEYLREPVEAKRQRLLGELKEKETLSVDLAAHVIEHLGPIIPTADLELGKIMRFEVGGGIAYHVMLPPEYNIYHRYPVIVTLHGQSHTPEQQIEWWAAQAMRHGSIVIAPEYLPSPQEGYKYDQSSHDAVLFSIIDARKRFAIDSDRIFLSGHSMGGHAAWDMGLAHADLFAGVIPICGTPQFYCKHYSPNAEHASFYVIDGEKNGGGPAANLLQLTKMMTAGGPNGFDVLYVEFKGRGHEHFSDEQLRLFDWMGRRARRKFPLNFSCRAARPFDNEFYFVSVEEYVPGVLVNPRLFDDTKGIQTARIEGKLTQVSNTILLNTRGVKSATLWISPGMVDLSQPVKVTVHGKPQSAKAVQVDLGVLLEDFRTRADRQKLFYAKLNFPRLAFDQPAAKNEGSKQASNR